MKTLRCNHLLSSTTTSALLSSLCLSFTSLQAIADTPGSDTPDPDMGDHPKFAHAMAVETQEVDDFATVFNYGQVRPDFQDLDTNRHRKTTLLSGEWQFQFDPQSKGIRDNWFSTNHNSSDWKDITVPHNWDAMPGGRFWDWNDRTETNPPHYNGAAWYRKTFNYKPGFKKRQRLVFLGVQQRARIYVNGEQIALFEGGGAPISIDVTEHLKSGSNTVALKVIRLVNNKKKADGTGWEDITYAHTMHPKAPDCWPYAGILRDVYLIEEYAVTLRKAFIYTENDDIKTVAIVSNHGKRNVRVRVKVLCSIQSSKTASSNVITVKAGSQRAVKVDLPGAAARASVWSPDSPVTYRSRFILESASGAAVGQLEVPWGKRTFEVSGTAFKLNGKTTFLKGASLYSENFERGGALTDSDHEEHFDLLKDSKSNFVRLHVIQRDPFVYQLADQQGVMVCGEWGGFWYNRKAMDTQTKDKNSIYQSMGRCAVWDLMNHPSVVMWGLNNECHQFCPEYGAFLKMGRELVHELDFLKRPITWSGWHPHKGQPYYEHADAVGFNQYRGAHDAFEDLDPDLAIVTKRNPNKPFIIMENGAWSVRGRRGKVTHRNTEDWQADLLKRQWNVLSKYTPHFAGYTYWLLKDYRSRKPYTGKKRINGYSLMGIYDGANEPKELVRDTFRDLPNPLK